MAWDGECWTKRRMYRLALAMSCRENFSAETKV